MDDYLTWCARGEYPQWLALVALAGVGAGLWEVVDWWRKG